MSASFKVGGKTVGGGHPAYFIAEIGSNHDGSLDQARRLIAAAAEAGADAVKFQSFTPDGLYVRRLREGSGWKEHPVWRALHRFQLPEAWLPELARAAAERSVHFMSAPFEPAAVDALERAGVPAHKIASGDLTHLALIRRAAAGGKPLFISTGMATPDEVAAALQAARDAGASGAALLHCVSLYPPRFEEMNLRAVTALSRDFGVPAGLSDHTPGHSAVLGALALGGAVFEKHITLDRSLKGPDHPYALLPGEFAAMVADARRLEASLGDGVKRPVEREQPERILARRGLYAARPIRRGETFSEENVKTVRPAHAVAADKIDLVLGAASVADLDVDEPIPAEQLAALKREAARP